MKIFITGGTGFVGSAIVKEALNKGYEVKLLVRDKNKAPKNVEIIEGDISNIEKLKEGVKDVDIVIHLVGIIKEVLPDITFQRLHVDATKNILSAIKSDGRKVKYYLHMSALGAGANANTEYFKTKWEAEELVKNSGLDYAIFRPSLIWGNEGFKKQLEDLANIPIFTPVLGKGEYRFQPVEVEKVANRFFKVLDDKKNNIATQRIYELGGEEVLTFDELLRKVEKEKGKKKIHIYFPMKLIKFMVKVTKFLRIPFPITQDQIKMIEAENFIRE